MWTPPSLDARKRALLIDASSALAWAVILVAASASGMVRMDERDAVLTASLVVGPLAFRRLAPTVTVALVGIGIVLTGGHVMVVDVAAFAVAAFSVAERATSRQRSFTSVVVVAGALGLWFARDGQVEVVAVSLLVALLGWLAGDAWRERRVRITARAEGERVAQDGRVQDAVREERRRLARELHDVIAHDVGIMVVQAGGARVAMDASPDRARTAMSTVEATGREALTELRRLLDVLADDPRPSADLEPNPTIADVDGLIRRMHAAGLPVRLRVEGEPRVLPDGVGGAAFRICQEALTNTMKHAPAAPTQVVLDYGSDALVVEVVDEGSDASPVAPTGRGRGVIGMRERAEAFGGTFEAGPRDGRGFVVRARLPLTPTSSG